MDVQGITIDGKTTRDRDDAIWAQSDARGWTVTVCIANVAMAITRGSTFDDTAHRRVETSYFAGDRNHPMLPRRFSEGSCSLSEGQERPVMAIRIRLDHTLETEFTSIDESRLVSQKQLAYDEIPSILDDKNHPLHPAISPMARLATGLMEKRRNAGAFVLYDLSNGWVMSEEGHLRKLKDTKETFGYIIVQELMILANAELAAFCAKNEIPVPFRNHTARASAPDREAMMQRLSLGLNGPVSDLEVARKQFNLVMNKANYGPVIEGHYGLNLPAYLHGTSPIRRYADLIVQRQILAFTAGRTMPYSAMEIAELSEHINAALSTKAAEVSKAAIQRANEQAQMAVRKDDLDYLSEKEFERVIKVAVRTEDFNPVVAEAFLQKLTNDKATLIDMHFILFKSKENWQPIRRSVIVHLVEYPHKAISIVMMAAQLNGWSEPKYKMKRGGDSDDAMTHTAKVFFHKPGVESSAITTPNKKLSQQRACVEALARSIDEVLPPWPKVAKKVKSDIGLPYDNSDNPISDLSEYCQSIGEELPMYNSRRTGGADHEPTFVVSCSALGFSADSPALSTKKIAKKQAAAHVIRTLRAREEKS